MFWFLNKVPAKPFNIVYDGTRINMSKVINKDEAERWYSTIQIQERKKIKRFIKGRQIESILPFFSSGEIITSEFIVFLKQNKNIVDQIIVVWIELLKEFDVVKDMERIWFMEKKEKVKIDWLPDWWLMLMKEFIMGMFRFDPILVSKTENRKKVTSELNIKQDYKDIQYTYKWEKFSTPLYWVYSPKVRKMIFWEYWMDFGWWRNMQKWQATLWYNLGRETVCAMSRWWGKSTIAVILCSVFPMRSIVSEREKVDWVVVYYYWPSHVANRAIIQKLLKMNSTMLEGKVFKKVEGWKIVEFISDWVVQWYIEFLSDNNPDPGRWWRATLVVIDEASRVSVNSYRVAWWFNNAMFIYISTVNYDTRKNWFYDILKDWEMRMNQYEETMDDIVVDIWRKYWLDKVESSDEFKTKARWKKLERMKEEFFHRRPLVWFRFTIDDVEYLSNRERQDIIKRKMKQGEQYLRAEEFSEFIDEDWLFNVTKNRIPTEDIPDVHDKIQRTQ